MLGCVEVGVRKWGKNGSLLELALSWLGVGLC